MSRFKLWDAHPIGASHEICKKLTLTPEKALHVDEKSETHLGRVSSINLWTICAGVKASHIHVHALADTHPSPQYLPNTGQN
jgi:hypothetical protein